MLGWLIYVTNGGPRSSYIDFTVTGKPFDILTYFL